MAVQYEHTDELTEKGIQINVEPTVSRRYQCRYKPYILILVSLLALLLILIVVWMIILLIRYDSPNTNIAAATLPEAATPTLPTTNATFDSITNNADSSQVKVVSRQEWLAAPPADALNLLNLPVPYVIIFHTATENCTDQGSCTLLVRFVQAHHIESRNFFDIGYNFLVGGDGLAYEGRGWKSEGAHSSGYNAKSIGIAFIGTFQNYLPPAIEILAAKRLIEKGVKLGYIAPDYKVIAARQVTMNTQSPGLKLFEDMKTWPHWSELP